MELQTISQVSRDCGISTRMLRYYEIERQHQRWQMYRRRPSRFVAKAGRVNLELRFKWFDDSYSIN